MRSEGLLDPLGFFFPNSGDSEKTGGILLDAFQAVLTQSLDDFFGQAWPHPLDHSRGEEGDDSGSSSGDLEFEMIHLELPSEFWVFFEGPIKSGVLTFSKGAENPTDPNLSTLSIAEEEPGGKTCILVFEEKPEEGAF